MPLTLSSCFKVVLILGFGLSASVADLTLGRRGLLPLPPTLMTVSIFLFLGTVGIFFDLIRTKGTTILALLLRNATILLSFFLIVAASILGSFLPGAYWHEGGKWIYLIVYGFTLFFSAMLTGLIPGFAGSIRPFLKIPLTLLLGSIFFELWNPGYFSTVETRPAGFAGNSNFGALSCNILCSAVLAYQGLASAKKDGFWLGITGLGILITQSRSGLVAFLVLLMFYLITLILIEKMNLQKSAKLAFGVVVAMGIVAGTFFMVLEYSGLFKTHRTRFDRFATSGNIDDGSSDSRLAAAEDAIRRIENSPILGNGTGNTRYMETPPHNLYLQQWVNNGLPGLASLLLLLTTSFLAFRKLRYKQGQGFILVVLVGGLFSHNILEQHPFLIVFGTLLHDSFFKSYQQR